MAPLRYLNFDLTFEAGTDGYTVRVTNSPAGQAAAPFVFPFEPLEFENFLLRLGQRSGGTRRADSPEMELSKQFGGRLFDALFDDDVRAALRSSVRAGETEAAGLRIRLRFGNAPELADVPWEFLYDSGANRFLTLSRETPLVRYLDLTRPVEPLAVSPPLRILVMISDPTDYERLDVEGEWARLNSALADLQRRGLVEIVRLDKATLLELQRALRDRQFHIFHYIGHGVFDEGADDGFLVLEDESGRGRKVSGQYVGTLLADHRSLRLAVLNSCEGGRSSRQDPYAGAAQSLVQQGLPAVAAMQFEISDDSAAVFAQEFYMALADGYPVDAALAEGRRAIFATKTNAEWGFPVLFMRAADGRIFDVQAAAPSPLPPEPVPADPPAPAEIPVQPAPAPEPKPEPDSGPTITLQDSEPGTVQAGASVGWEKRIEPKGSTPNELRMVKIIGGVILGAFVLMALLFYLIFRNSTEQATPAALVAPAIEFFEAEPEKVVAGEQQKVQLTWSITGDVTGVALSGPDVDSSLVLSSTGSLLVDLSGPATFRLSAANYDQTASRQVTVSVVNPTATPAAGDPSATQEITVTFESVRIIDDCDNILTGLGEFWLELTVNDERLRWPESGTNEVNSGDSYPIGQRLTTRVAAGETLRITAAGFEVDEFQTESMGSIWISHNAGDGWGVGRGSQTSLAVCQFVLNYSISLSEPKIDQSGPTTGILAPTASVSTTTSLSSNVMMTPTPPPAVTLFDVNLRAGPGTDYKWMDSVTEGEELDIIGKNSDSSWYVLSNGNWIASFLVRNAPEVPTVATPTPPPSPAYVPLSIEAYANDNIQDLFSDFPSGRVVVKGVTFEIPASKNKVSTQCELSSDPVINSLWPREVTIPTDEFYGLQAAYIVITGGYVSVSTRGKSVGEIVFQFTNGTTYSYELISGLNIRDWNYRSSDSVSELTGPDISEFFSGINIPRGPVVMDLITISIPQFYQGLVLESITVRDNSLIREGVDTCLFFSAITLFAQK